MVENNPQTTDPQEEQEDTEQPAVDPKTNARILAQRKRADLKKRERAGRALETSGRTAEYAGKATRVGGKAMQAGGKAVGAGGDALMKAGTGLSGTGVGAIAGVPLAALGGLTKAAGKGTEVAGKGVEKIGQGVEKAGKAAKNAGKQIKQGARQQDNFLKTFQRATKLAEKFGVNKNKILDAKKKANLAKIASKGAEDEADKLLMSAFRKLYLAGIGTVYLIPVAHFFMSVHFFIKHWARLDVKLLPKFQLVDFLIFFGLCILLILTIMAVLLFIIGIVKEYCWLGIELIEGACD